MGLSIPKGLRIARANRPTIPTIRGWPFAWPYGELPSRPWHDPCYQGQGHSKNTGCHQDQSQGEFHQCAQEGAASGIPCSCDWEECNRRARIHRIGSLALLHSLQHDRLIRKHDDIVVHSIFPKHADRASVECRTFRGFRIDLNVEDFHDTSCAMHVRLSVAHVF